jgi:DNA-dependent RNA polymerase
MDGSARFCRPQSRAHWPLWCWRRSHRRLADHGGARATTNSSAISRSRSARFFYANVTMAKAAKEAKGKNLRHLQWRRFVLQGKLKPGRHETPTDWLARLRRTRFAIWQSLTEDASREEQIRAGSWLLARAVEADLVILIGKDLLPASRWREDLKRLQGIIIRANVRLLPLAEKPAHWKKPEIYRSGLKVRFLPHWNRAHQASIAASFRSQRFQRQHLAAINRLADVPLSVDEWTRGLVHGFAAEVRNHKDADRRLAYETQVDRDVKTAGMMARRGAFHNSYHVDFRGRLYADQAFNYAQQDSVRSMFRFARGAEITGAGLQWLMIHVANCYGEDKRSYDGRIAWTSIEHYDDIERVANDPRGSFDFWSNADKPFAFAAACRELVNVDTNPRSITTLPIGFDHTASGLQHLALIGLDEKAAPLVNLVNCAAPRDIYDELAARTLKLFDDSPEAKFWRERFVRLEKRRPGNVRKLLKHPGMTFSYASTSRGNIRQIYDAHYDLIDAYHELGEDELPFEMVRYLVDCFRTACAEMLPGPERTMGYIQSTVKACNKANRFMEWPTPSGLWVSNLYPKLHAPTVYLLDGVKNTIADGAIPNTINRRKTKSSAAANFVHSLDASHLARTINALAANEMDALCVHDCFAVLAPHAEQFHITNREELALMYTKCFRTAARWSNCVGRTAMSGTLLRQSARLICGKCNRRSTPAAKPKRNSKMSRRYIDEQVLDGIARLNGAIWFSILEALGPKVAARVADNMRDFGVLYSDNPYCEQLCNTLADAELEAQEGSFDFRDLLVSRAQP